MPGMRIASKLRWFTIILIVLTSLSVAMIGYWGNSAIISDLQTESLRERARMEVDRLNLAFAELNRDIRFIYNLPMVATLANGAEFEQVRGQHAKDNLALIFEQMLKAKPDYSQIRIIQKAEGGMELVRVDRQDGEIYRVPDQDLQAKGSRSYFMEACQLDDGEIYHSSINLNKEHGVIEYPIRPVFRVAMPVYDKLDAVYGIVIINVDFDAYMQGIFGGNVERERYDYYLLNQFGDFLFHPDPTHTFGFDLGFDIKATDEFTGLGDFFENTEEWTTFRVNSLSEHAGELVHFTKFKVFNPKQELVFGIIASYDDIGRASFSIMLKIIGAIFICILLSVLLTFRFSAKLTEPLERIIHATRRMADHDHEDIHLPTDRSDEIGDLANTFEQMKFAIRKHQDKLMCANQRLAEMNRDLEHFARVASHDLREPIQRIAGLASLFEVESECGHREEASSILVQLHSECDKALTQLADFREFTRISEDSSLIREDVAIEEIVSSVLVEYAELIEQRGIEVEVQALPRLKVYKNLVHVLYRNLVSNALKHSTEDGFSLCMTCSEEGSDYVLGVRNSSSVIAKENYDVVFDIFRKLDDGHEGNGTGLAICKRIVDFHAGRIWVESNDNVVHIKFFLKSE